MAATVRRFWLGESRWRVANRMVRSLDGDDERQGRCGLLATARMVACGVVRWGTGASLTRAAEVEAPPPVRFGWGMALPGTTRCPANLVIAVR